MAYNTTLRTNHVDNVLEPVSAADINAIAAAANAIGNDANTGGPLDLPSHKTSGDHDGRYPLLSALDPYTQYHTNARGDARYVQVAATHTRSRNFPLLNPSGTFPLIIPIWRVPYAITIVAIYGYRVGGTASSINARKVSGGTASNFLTADYSIATTGGWVLSTGLAAAGILAMAAGDSLEVLFQTMPVSPNTPTLVEIQVDFTEPVQ